MTRYIIMNRALVAFSNLTLFYYLFPFGMARAE